MVRTFLKRAAVPIGRGRNALSIAMANIGLGFSFWLFPNRYFFYRWARRLGNAVFRRDDALQTPLLVTEDTVVIEGFRYSANSFLVSNVAPDDRCRIRSHSHRPWMLQQAVAHKLPTIVLIRNPLDAATSLYRRSRGVDLIAYGAKLSLFTCLIAWLGYYAWVWRLRYNLIIVCFDDVTKNYADTIATLERKTGVRFLKEPRFDQQNKFPGMRMPVTQPWYTRFALLMAQGLYLKILRHVAATEDRAQVTKTVLS